MGKIDWTQLVQLESKWIEKHLKAQTHTRDFKTLVRGYTIPFSGTNNDHQSFTRALGEIIGQFTHSKAEIERLGVLSAHGAARKMFGNIQPSTEGKYGELILFALVESILQCPMVAHKIPSSFHDQVKGGDGIFIGDYEYSDNKYHPAILIGESKIWQDYAAALKDSLESVNRFHDDPASPRFNSQEFIVARKGMVTANGIDPEVLYNYLTPDTEEYRQNILVHPTFIMYETPQISTIEGKALTTDEAENLIKTYITSRHDKHLELINEKLGSYPGIKTAYLDFFILPVKNVDKFRDQLFYEIHGVPYTKLPTP
jgi:hypothetical protein